MGAGASLSPVSTVDVSVVIPVFNRFDVLTEAVASVLAQTRLPKEIVIVDDGSTEGDADLLFSHPDVGIRVVKLPRNGGAPVARNTGVLAATGSWIAFLDADDVWEPTKLARQIEQVESFGGQLDAVATNILLRQPGRADVAVNPRAPHFDSELSLDLMMRDMALQTSSLMIKRGMLLRHPFDAELTRHQDWDLVLRLTRAGCRWGYLDEPLSVYRADYDPRRISASKHRMEGTKFWLTKRDGVVDPRAAAYYFSRKCLYTALRRNFFASLKVWTWLSTRSVPALAYSVMGLAQLIFAKAMSLLPARPWLERAAARDFESRPG